MHVIQHPSSGEPSVSGDASWAQARGSSASSPRPHHYYIACFDDVLNIDFATFHSF